MTRIQSGNGTVHRAAANDVDFNSRATRGSVCNGLLFGLVNHEWSLFLCRR